MDRPWIALEQLTAQMVELARANAWEELATLAPRMDAMRLADADWRKLNPGIVDTERTRSLEQAAANLREVAEHVTPAHQSMSKLLKVLARKQG